LIGPSKVLAAVRLIFYTVNRQDIDYKC
jgi:hypothetical protein